MTSILRSGPWGPGPQQHCWPKGKDRTEGTGHVGVLAKGWGREGGVWSGAQEHLHSWEGPKRPFACSARIPYFTALRPELRMEGTCPRMDPPPQSTREGGCPGAIPRTPVSAFSPPVGAWSLGWGGSDESVKHNLSPGGTKEGRSQGWGRWPPRSTRGPPTGHSHRATGWGCLLLSRDNPDS